ncbi:UNVERIFIED_CONTAM: hypothetical protein RMT77_009424 [Armadillidium vulgare]
MEYFETSNHNDSFIYDDNFSFNGSDSFQMFNGTINTTSSLNLTNDFEPVTTTSMNKTVDGSISHSTPYELQLIKVGVLCGVLTVLVLSTCRMILKVFAQHVDRDKPIYSY